MNDFNDRKVLVTGGAGFIGSHLVDALIRENCQVRVLDNLTNGKLQNVEQHKNNKKFELIKGDVTVPADNERAMKDIDLVFHLACLGVRHSLKYPWENHRVNAEGTLRVLEAAQRAKVNKFIYCSSSEVYGTAEVVPMTEQHPTFPCTVYGASKLAGEAYTRAFHKSFGLKAVIIRTFNSYGPRSHHEGAAGEVIPKSIVRALNIKPVLIFGDGRQTRDFTYVEDTALGLIAAARHEGAIGRTFNMGSNFEISINEVVELILGLAKAPKTAIEYHPRRPGDVSRLFADSSVFRKITQWKPQVSLQEGLSRTIAWFKSRPDISQLIKEEVGVNWE